MRIIKNWLKKLCSAEILPFTLDDAAQNGAEIISCTSQPMNLRPAVAAIVERIEKVSASLNERPLVVLVGENHELPSHKILQTLLLQKLNTRRPRGLAYGMEIAGTTPARVIETIETGARLTPEEKYRLNTDDPSGQTALITYLAYINPASAPVARHTQLDFCRRAEIPTRFTDAAETASEDLDAKDPITGQIMKDNPPGWRDSTQGQEGTSAYDFKIRNLVMTHEAQKHLQQTGAQLYIQQAGVAHILGSKPHKSGCQDSLHARFKDAGFDTLSVIMTSKPFDLGDLPAEARRHMSECVVVTGLDEKTVKGYDGDEAEYIKALSGRSQAHLDIFDYKADPGRREALQEQIDRHARQWVKSLRTP
ncbi:MAG: hypothetical protein HYS17_05380 [Micavibrio aeruginosavorus]|uniref:Haem-binding uptake Tiki superfamily ChaN domain-containing protein n=1 Tax=Micavibrio aeruginosavorus TaxID=349221 RepID=A0A7T5R4D4_9BACT|nr:MAG: hypothetical protein HYS17_05380 [Micavibrio aeruginosavorus]